MAYSRHGPTARGMGPFGTQAGSSTAARNAARSPLRKAASIFLKISNSLQRSASDRMVGASRRDRFERQAIRPRSKQTDRKYHDQHTRRDESENARHAEAVQKECNRKRT